ncbi:hypothetical protein PAAG_11147 [Paracoccidioides lutzii Pb01]|uniref:Uncharacterized protein n=1 Tax=Paracoccidioides lutzii (strain ATCC MYA-826 / Pb01) TaxID=502779 RepID=A0A0A2V775_PARBA|nr:hypothetical protein PAAG_11147 [Paracoccidioides lutzii Pb01]KGQ01975.1 hypothetical protein PAAG_11147 [Paracoccidioides lutzii Pb01]
MDWLSIIQQWKSLKDCLEAIQASPTAFKKQTSPANSEDCLEQSFRVFADPDANPKTIYQLFRLVLCIRERTKMGQCFERLINVSVNDLLEVASLPFYCIQGAGTHYPCVGYEGNPRYPVKMRLPGRILGLLPMPETGSDSQSTQDGSQQYLEIFGFGGQ